MATPTSKVLSSNPTYLKTKKSDKFYSSRLLNFTEPVEIGGFRKTVFYTENNTNFNVGDRVFIVNGNYDSDVLISNNKFTRYTDGYRVLACDGCRIILDIDYDGTLPFVESNYNDFIKVVRVNNPREFDYINTFQIAYDEITVTNDIGIPLFTKPQGFASKFFGKKLPMVSGSSDQYCVLFGDSLVFLQLTDYLPPDPVDDLSINGGISGGSGFFVRDDSNSPPQWIDVTEEFLAGRVISINPRNNLNNSILIVGEDIVLQTPSFTTNLTLRQRSIYTFDGTTWKTDILYKDPFISKLNFRYGTFRGDHKDGVFGTNLKINNWGKKLGSSYRSLGATWQSGIFLNSNWNFGIMNSKSADNEKTYYSKLSLNETTNQKVRTQSIDFTNNKGFGRNLVVDTNLFASEVNNGVFERVNFGYSLSNFSKAIDNFYDGLTFSYPSKINKAKIKFGDIQFSSVNNATLQDCQISESNINNSKLINSQITKSTANLSEYSDKSGIKILASDIWSYNRDESSLGTDYVRGILKLYISDDDILRLNISNSFYISRVNKEYILSSLDEQQKIILPFETKYILDSYVDHELKEDERIVVTFKSKNDNKIKYYVSYNGTDYNNTFETNTTVYSSIDIDHKLLGYWKDSTNNTTVYSDDFLLSPVTFTTLSKVFNNTYIHNADFKFGVFYNSTWLSGDNVNISQNIITRNQALSTDPDTNLLKISRSDENRIYIYLSDKFFYSHRTPPTQQIVASNYFDFEINNKDVWLSGVSVRKNNDPVVYDLSGRYQVGGRLEISQTGYIRYTLTRKSNQVWPDTFDEISINEGEKANYISIHPLLIDNSKIVSGLFKRNLIKNSTIENSEFNNRDKNLDVDNTNTLRLVNHFFKNSNNNVKSGLVYKSHFINDTWTNGIFFNSIWNKGTFNNGIFKSSYWLDGIFNNGSFIDSKGLTTSTYLAGSNYNYDLTSQYMSWIEGTFSAGEFYKSAWSDGTFENGRFYNSDWYGGDWKNGILGSRNLNYTNTTLGSLQRYIPTAATFTTWENGIVENALVGGSGSVYWLDGKFDNGEFTSFGSQSTNESIWYNGDFNGGKLTLQARWKDGNFNKGKFLSEYGYTNVKPIGTALTASFYGWENGKFNGGEFGNSSTATNSVWYTGEFNDGIFAGRYWYSGTFNKGSFLGSGTFSLSDSPTDTTGEFDFANSFTSSYYGLWRSGNVIDTPEKIKSDGIIFTELTKDNQKVSTNNLALFDNMLWLSGTFSHVQGTFKNSLFLSGSFQDGNFDSSIFNPYVDRTFTGSFSKSSFASTASIVWENGKFNSNYGTGSFYHAEWKKGTFNSGYMAGAKWTNGTWNYGTAENIYWEDGLWRNGNWNGSPFDYTSLATWSNTRAMYVLKGKQLDLIRNVSRFIGTSSLHVINAFSSSIAPQSLLTDPNLTANIDFFFTTPTASMVMYGADANTIIYNDDLKYNGVIGYTIPGSSTVYTYNEVRTNASKTRVFGELDRSYWNKGSTFSLRQTNNQIFTISDTHYFTKGGDLPEVASPAVVAGYNSTQRPDIAPSRRLYGHVGNVINLTSLEIFDDASTTYEINLVLSVELITQVGVEFGIGALTPYTAYLDSDSYTTGSGSTIKRNYYPKIYEITLNYTPTAEQLLAENSDGEVIGNKFWIRKATQGILRILSAQVTKKSTEYHPSYNNVVIQNLVVGNTASLPNDAYLRPTATSDNGNLVSINYGNGVFRSGIWENGVWNNGFRGNTEWFDEQDYILFSDVIGIDGLTPTTNLSTVQIDDITWNVALKSIDEITNLSLGDKVSVGNIVAIDVNEQRKLIKDWFRIINIDYTNNIVVLKLVSNFPIRRIVRDSFNHLIYVTKNIWLSGAFLNGGFRGVWNNGLFKGYPKITQMYESQMIDGKIDGGRFTSNKSSNPLNPDSIYNTGLVQKMSFVDNNVGLENEKKYLSFMDVVYENFSKSNLNLPEVVFSEVPQVDGTTQSVVKNLPNLDGLVTLDVLESQSTFRDFAATVSRDYKLGTKFSRFENLMPDNGFFFKQFSNNYSNQLFGPQLTITNFTNDGWEVNDITSRIATYSFNYGVGEIQITPAKGIKIDSNRSSQTAGRLVFTFSDGGAQTKSGVGPGLGQYRVSKRHSFELRNNDITTLVDRYYAIELDIASSDFSGATSSKTINRYSKILLTDFNHQETSLTKKVEFFYNRQNLDLVIDNRILNENISIGTFDTSNYPPTSNLTTRISFRNISFTEVDMVPFFQYATATSIYEGIKIPLKATAPYIDYTDSNFDFIGNVNLNFDTQGIVQQQPLSQQGGISSVPQPSPWNPSQLNNYSQASRSPEDAPTGGDGV
jgi:hypothetical protein